jgi:beta-N-acetylhexosaminidase
MGRLRSVELAPFEAAIAAGVDGVMTAHVYVPAVEPRENLAATLSRRVLTDLLRAELGYRGLILTDALEMAAITKDRSAAAAAVDAFEAGADLLLIAGISQDDRLRAADGPSALAAAVEGGRIAEERLDASVLRILEAKARRGVLPGAAAPPKVKLQELNSGAHRDLALAVARRAVTLQRDIAGLLPLSADAKVLVVDGVSAGQSDVVDDQSETSLLGAIRYFAARAFAGTTEEADVIVLGTFDLVRDAEQQRLARRLVATGKPVVGVCLRGPYDAAAAPEIGTFVAIYGDRPVHLQAAAEALFGAIVPAGSVP